MALDPINETLASFDQIRGEWTLDYLAKRQAEQQREAEEKARLAEQEAARLNEQLLMDAQLSNTKTPKATDPMAGWDEALPGVYKQVKDGKTSYTNVLDAAGAPSMNAIVGIGGARQTSAAPIIPNDQTTNATDFNFQSKMAQIESEKDPRAKLKLFFDLQEATAAHTSEAAQLALEQAGAKFGLSQAEALLAQNEAQDRADPQWSLYQTDSPMTKQQRAIVDGIRSRATAEANTYLKMNPKINAMSTRIESMAKLLEYDLKQADRVTAQEDRQTETRALKAEQEAYRRERNLLELSPNMKARIIAIDPSLSTMPEGPTRDKAMADFYETAKSNPDIKAIILAPTEALLQEAVVSGNDQAERVVAMEELSRNPGKSMVQVREEISKIRSLVQDDALLAQALLQRVGGKQDDPTYAGFVSLASAKRAGATTKAQNDAYTEQKYSLARSLMQEAEVSKFISDVSSWGIVNPALQAAIESAKATTGKANFDEVAAAYVGNTIGPERAAKSEELRQAMYQAASAKSNSLIAVVNPEVVWNRWLMQKARITLAQKLGRSIEATATSAVNTLGTFGPSPLQLALIPAIAFQNVTGDVSNESLNK